MVFAWKNEDEVPASFPKKQSAATPVPAADGENLLTVNGIDYRYYFFKLRSEDSLELIPNFKERRPARLITSENNCRSAINAGFYTESGLPLGLFFAEGRLWTNIAQSLTFNGFLAKTKSGKPEIISARGADDLITRIGRGELDFVFQTGPLYDLAAPKQPNFIDIKYARRHLIAQDRESNFYFFSVFEKGSLFNGPMLKDIPVFFAQPEIRRVADFQRILNLDGGSASYYFDKENEMSEANPVGAILCEKSVQR